MNNIKVINHTLNMIKICGLPQNFTDMCEKINTYSYKTYPAHEVEEKLEKRFKSVSYNYIQHIVSTYSKEEYEDGIRLPLHRNSLKGNLFEVFCNYFLSCFAAKFKLSNVVWQESEQNQLWDALALDMVGKTAYIDAKFKSDLNDNITYSDIKDKIRIKNTDSIKYIITNVDKSSTDTNIAKIPNLYFISHNTITNFTNNLFWKNYEKYLLNLSNSMSEAVFEKTQEIKTVSSEEWESAAPKKPVKSKYQLPDLKDGQIIAMPLEKDFFKSSKNLNNKIRCIKKAFRPLGVFEYRVNSEKYELLIKKIKSHEKDYAKVW